MAKIKKEIGGKILDFIKQNPHCSSKEIDDGLNNAVGYATIKRALQDLLAENLIIISGRGKSTKYEISQTYGLIRSIDVEEYFQKEIDDREIQTHFNHSLISKTLSKASLFTDEELKHLEDLQKQYEENISKLTAAEYKKELERLAIDLSWKSSQIEGNTYSLLETERLLKDKETASGKTKDEATMLLNHKAALDFIIDHPKYIKPLSLSGIEDIHSILVKDLDIDRNIRKRKVVFQEPIINHWITNFKSRKLWRKCVS